MRSLIFLVSPLVAAASIAAFVGGIVYENLVESEPFAPVSIPHPELFVVVDAADGDSTIPLTGQMTVSYEVCLEKDVDLIFDFALATTDATRNIQFSHGSIPWPTGCRVSAVEDIPLPVAPCDQLPAGLQGIVPCGLTPGAWLFTGTFTVVEGKDAQTIPVHTAPFEVVAAP